MVKFSFSLKAILFRSDFKLGGVGGGKQYSQNCKAPQSKNA